MNKNDKLLLILLLLVAINGVIYAIWSGNIAVIWPAVTIMSGILAVIAVLLRVVIGGL
jgi:hypothetical protein